MKRSAFLFLTVVLALAPAALLAGPATPMHRGGGGQTAVTGVYSVTFNLNLASTLPAGAAIVCKAQIVPGQQYSFSQSQTQQVESAAAVAQVSGSTATCAVEIPFSWTVSGNASGAVLSYEIDAVNPSGTLPVNVRVSGQSGLAQAFPTSGGTAGVSLNVTF